MYITMKYITPWYLTCKFDQSLNFIHAKEYSFYSHSSVLQYASYLSNIAKTPQNSMTSYFLINMYDMGVKRLLHN